MSISFKNFFTLFPCSSTDKELVQLTFFTSKDKGNDKKTWYFSSFSLIVLRRYSILSWIIDLVLRDPILRSFEDIYRSRSHSIINLSNGNRLYCLLRVPLNIPRTFTDNLINSTEWHYPLSNSVTWTKILSPCWPFVKLASMSPFNHVPGKRTERQTLLTDRLNTLVFY